MVTLGELYMLIPLTKEFYLQYQQSFLQEIMIVAKFCYEGGKNIKVNIAYFQESIMTPMYHTDIPFLYGAKKNQIQIYGKITTIDNLSRFIKIWRKKLESMLFHILIVLSC
jgi:hypothetical protein